MLLIMINTDCVYYTLTYTLITDRIDYNRESANKATGTKEKSKYK